MPNHSCHLQHLVHYIEQEANAMTVSEKSKKVTASHTHREDTLLYFKCGGGTTAILSLSPNPTS